MAAGQWAVWGVVVVLWIGFVVLCDIVAGQPTGWCGIAVLWLGRAGQGGIVVLWYCGWTVG